MPPTNTVTLTLVDQAGLLSAVDPEMAHVIRHQVLCHDYHSMRLSWVSPRQQKLRPNVADQDRLSHLDFLLEVLGVLDSVVGDEEVVFVAVDLVEEVE